MRRCWVLGAPFALLGLLGCGSNDGQAVDPVTREVEAWVEVVRSVALAGLPAPEEGDDVPVVFTVDAAGDSVSAEVQVEVVKALRDEADVRFLDDREEALDVDEPDEPVKDDGVLVAMSELPEAGRRVELEVERYQSTADSSQHLVVLRGGTPEWTVVSVTPTVVPRI